MKIETEFKIEVIAERAQRDVLNHVQIGEWQGKPVAVAADGFCLAVVPVALEEGDVPGLVHWQVFAAARDDDASQRFGEMHFALGEDRITFPDGWTAPRTLTLPGGKPFPNWQALIPDRTHLDDAWPAFGINPRLLTMLYEAMGANSFVILHRVGATAPILVAGSFQDGPPVPPFGLIMPVQASSLPSDSQWRNWREGVLAKVATA